MKHNKSNTSVYGEWIYESERKCFVADLTYELERYKALGHAGYTESICKCSNCGIITIVDASIRYEYCPHCGAMMGTEEE